MKKKHSLNTTRLNGLNKCLHDLIHDDLSRGGSLILANMLKRFNELKQESAKSEIPLKEVIYFAYIRPTRSPKTINEQNARQEIASYINEKLSNLRASRTVFTIKELLAYCQMLDVNPETVLIQAANPCTLLPVQYCTEQEVRQYLDKAKKSGKIDRPIRIPFWGVPILGVSADAYFTASDKIGLDDQIECSPLTVEKSNLSRNNKTRSSTSSSQHNNWVQLETIITVKKFDAEMSVQYFVPGKDTNDGNDVRSYLIHTGICFLKKCKDRYLEEQEYLSGLDFYDKKDLFGQYSNLDMLNALNMQINRLYKKTSKKRFEEVYPESRLIFRSIADDIENGR